MANAFGLESACCILVVVKLDASNEEVNVLPNDLEVTEELDADQDFELDFIGDQDGSNYLCHWKATIMTCEESDFFEMEGYTFHAVPHSEIPNKTAQRDSFHIVQWEPTWEPREATNDVALETWRIRQAAQQPACSDKQPSSLSTSRKSPEGGTTAPRASPPDGKKRAVVVIESSDEEDCYEVSEFIGKAGGENKRARAKAAATVGASSTNAIDVDSLDGDDTVPAVVQGAQQPQQGQPPPQVCREGQAVPVIGRHVSWTRVMGRRAYGAVCTVWQPHLVLAIDGDVRESPHLQHLFGGRSGQCAASLGQPRFLWLSVMHDHMDHFLSGGRADGVVDAYPGSANDCIHPSRQLTSKVMAFEGKVRLSGGDGGGDASGGGGGGGGASPTIFIDLQMHAPSAELSEQCRRSSTPRLPYKVETPFVGQAIVCIEVTQARKPYLTHPSSARPGTPRCKVHVRLLEGQGRQSLFARAYKAALDVCALADSEQNH